MQAKKGFTLVELLLVVLIISVLAAIVVPRMSGASDGAKSAKCDANLTNVVKALERYVATNGKYPVNNSAFHRDIINSKTYFPHGKPKCPWGYIYAYTRPGHPFVTARGGSPYVSPPLRISPFFYQILGSLVSSVT